MRRLAIAVVAYEMEGAATGVGRYLEGVLGGLARSPERHDRAIDLTLFMKGDPFAHPLFEASNDTVRVRAVFDRRPGSRPILWEQLRLPTLLRRHDVDLVFSPSYSLPPRLPAPAVVTIHDLSFEHLPEAFPARERWRRRILARRAAKRAARVLADTETIARELRSAYGLEPDKVAVVPLAVDPRFRPEATPGRDPASGDDEALAPLGIDSPFLLVLGTVLDRRRIDAVVAAFDRLLASGGAPEGLTLVIAGRNRLRDPTRLDAWIEGARSTDRIRRLDWVPESALPALYRRAAAAIYLSTYEGFGLPPLEALACGTPAVVSTGLGLDDLWPDYALRLDGFEPARIASTLETALGPAGHALGREGAARMARLDWRQAADRFLAIAEQATKIEPGIGMGDPDS